MALLDNKIKVNELAKKINASNKRVMEILNEINIFPKSTMSTLSEDELKAFYAHTGFNPDKEKPQAAKPAEKTSAESSSKTNAAPKMTGTVIKRIVRSASSDDYYNSEAEDKTKKNARQSTVASSGLRSGYVSRSEATDAAEAQKAKTAAAEPAAKPVVSTSDAPKIVRRVKKADLQPKTEEPAAKEPAQTSAEEAPKAEVAPEAKPEVAEKPASKEAPKTDVPKAESAPEVKAEEKQETVPQTAAPQASEETKPAEPVRKPSVSSEPRRGPVYISRGNPVEPRPRPGMGQRPEGRPGDRPQRPEGGNREGFNRDRSGAPRFGGQNGGRMGGRDGRPGAGRGPVIPQVDPALLAGQEPRRDYAGKMYDKNQEKNSKKEGKRDSSRPTGGGKDKYREGRQFVGAKMGVSEIYSDDYHSSYDMESYGQKRSVRKKEKGSFKDYKPVAPVIAVLTNVTLPATMTVKEFAESIKKTSAEVIKKLMLMGVMATQNQVIDFDTAALIASEFNITAEQEVVITTEERLFDDSDETMDENAVERPPVVVVMGHVDHGKTSLLDAIRSTSVTTGEAGGITQHIGAYMVKIKDRKITFLDTPGHEAFTAMRARGAQVTDVAIIVVAADDGVMPQTVEAINHAKAAKVSIVVAVNKIDKPAANIERVMTELAEHEIISEDWGGDIPFVPVSAKTGENIETLLETVLLSADILQLKANPERQAKGTIIEAKLDKNRGPVATLLVQRGTLHPGDAIVSGVTFGHIRTMTDDRGHAIKKAGPSTPVEITGLPEVPEAGEVFYAVEDEHLAKQLIEQRKDEIRAKALQATSKVSLETLNTFIEAGKMKDLNIIVKADVVGSVEAMKQSLLKLSNEEVRINIIHGAVGAITESDVTLADVSNAIIIGFNVRPGVNIAEHAKARGVDMKLYRVIYDAIDDVQDAIKGMLAPQYEEVIHGHASVRQTFKVSGVGTIAGAYVTDGSIVRNSDVRIVHDGIVVFEGKLASLKRFKDDAKEVQQNYECGLSFEGFNDVKEGDVVECYTMEEIKKG
ncbi:MAG: translation initiation factor IF-2 [Clostridia bacterium]|nr:translation initiation factor IF-2 [Clostridia bacterium]